MEHETHEKHDHEHRAGCGHQAVQHEGHTDYLHDGHLHHEHAGHVDEHRFDEKGTNAASCTPGHACGEHAREHGAVSLQ